MARRVKYASPEMGASAAMVTEKPVITRTSTRAETRAPAANRRELAHYFEYSQKGIDVVEDGLKEIHFGEFLVEQQRLDRYQLFRALQLQDRHPGVRIGECAAALGYVQIGEIEKLHSAFAQLGTITI